MAIISSVILVFIAVEQGVNCPGHLHQHSHTAVVILVLSAVNW